MSYLEQLKSENPHQGALPKLTKPPFDSFDSRGKRHFSGNQAPAVAVDIDTPTGRRSITSATTCQGEPTEAAVDIADRILDHLAAQGHPVDESGILAAVGGDEVFCRNILHRLAVEGLAEYQGGGLYDIPSWIPKAPDLPKGCPLTGAPFPETGCKFHPRLFARLKAEGVLPLPGGRCPVRLACKLEDGQ